MIGIRKFQSRAVSGFLHEPGDPGSRAIVLTHGAGGNSQSALLVAVAEAFAASGVWVLRCDMPFRQLRPYGPPSGDGKADREGLLLACTELRSLTGQTIYLAGHSYGGRQASILAVEEPGACDGLLLLSYPLHPPKQPQNLRTGHFGKLQAAALFVHGAKDPFGSLTELRSAMQLISSPTAVVSIEGAGHDLLKGKLNVEEQIVEPFNALLNSQ